MARQRVQGSADGVDAAHGDDPNQVGSAGPDPEEDTKPDAAHVESPNARGGARTSLGGPKGVRIMFNACQRDDHGNVTPPGERVVSEDEALAFVKQGVATLL